MNSWDIMRSKLIINTRPGTMVRNVQVNRCAELFVALRHLLSDNEESTESFNGDSEVREAISVSG